MNTAAGKNRRSAFLTADTVRQWLPVLLPISLAILAGGLWLGRLEMQMSAHAADDSRHMPYDVTVRTFCTREEFQELRARISAMDDRQRAILQTLTRIETKLE